MTNLNEVYKCNVCENMVEVVHTGASSLVCCGVPMELLVEKNQDEGSEKHVPVIGKFFDTDPDETQNAVLVGSIQHPMEEGHHIEWIEIIYNGSMIKKHLKLNELPKILFDLSNLDKSQLKLRAYCNIHGLWKS